MKYPRAHRWCETSLGALGPFYKPALVPRRIAPGSNDPRRSLKQVHPPSHALQRLQRFVELLARVLASQDQPNARLALRHRWERDAGAQDSLLKQRTAEVHRRAPITDDQRRDRRLRRGRTYAAHVEARAPQFTLEVA